MDVYTPPHQNKSLAKLLGASLLVLPLALLALADQLEMSRALAQQRLRLGRHAARELPVHLVDIGL